MKSVSVISKNLDEIYSIVDKGVYEKTRVNNMRAVDIPGFLSQLMYDLDRIAALVDEANNQIL